MATRDIVIRVLMYLTAAYPDQGSKLDPRVLEMQNEIYIKELSDVPDATLEEAAQHHVRECDFFPKVSELRRAAKLIDPEWVERMERRKFTSGRFASCLVEGDPTDRLESGNDEEE